MPLTQKQLAELQETLLKERQRILLGARGIEADDAKVAGDLGDQCTELSERELMLEMAEQEREHLLEVNEALERIEGGTYGVCEESGEEIPYERLRAVPTAKYTVKCQEVIERRRQY